MAEEWLTRGTVWLALSLYTTGEMARCQFKSPIAARRLNTFGCAAFLAHVACAFHFYHGWSHSAAYADTARQTAALTGWDSGSGLYINYLFTLVWIVDALWSWTKPTRPRWITWSVRAFFWFMIFNGGVVFVKGPMRGLGSILCLVLLACWWRGSIRK